MNGKFAVNVERSLDPWTGPFGIAIASLTIAILELGSNVLPSRSFAPFPNPMPGIAGVGFRAFWRQ